MRHAEDGGLAVERTQSLQAHYARTLDIWAQNLQARKAEAIELASPEIYEKYMRYLTGCARYFKSGHVDLYQFTLAPASHSVAQPIQLRPR
jgi:cyclopropane-fatty-acyl-phospholipid synthase